MTKSLHLTLAFLLLVLISCGKTRDDAYDTNTDVPKGDPRFTPLGTSWVIDNAGVLDKETIHKCDAICQKLQDDGIAEMVVLVQKGVKHPSDYATHYGRWLGLGRKGLSTEGGNNGVVWLVRPDADEKMTYSIGRGLPGFTTNERVDIMNKAKEYFDFQNYDQGVIVLVQETDRVLRAMYGKRGKG